MKKLTYRGIVYQKPESSASERKLVSDARHIYRGQVYHYEPSKTEIVS